MFPGFTPTDMTILRASKSLQQVQRTRKIITFARGGAGRRRLKKVFGEPKVTSEPNPVSTGVGRCARP